jgi:hypothetical protein
MALGIKAILSAGQRFDAPFPGGGQERRCIYLFFDMSRWERISIRSNRRL